MTRALLTAALAGTLLFGCDGDDDDPNGNGTDAGVDAGTEDPGNIVEVASANADFSILVAAVTKAGLADTLSDESATLTVFAPTNAAFETLFDSLGATNGLDDVTAEQLRPILRYHVMDSEVRAEAATTAAQANQKVDTLGGKVQLSFSGGAIRLDDSAQVTTADIDASNGVIHVIDAVLLPSITDIATTDSRFSSLAAALVAADGASPSPGLVAALDDDGASAVTVFAPVNDGFSALLTALAGTDDGATTGVNELGDFRPDQLVPVLTYHVVPARVLAADVPESGDVDTLGGKVAVTRAGSSVTVDGVSVVEANVLASNGVIHGIGSVLLPSITDVVTTSPSLTGLKDAVLAADGDGSTDPKVAEALNGAGPFTLFAPDNAAFGALPATPSGQALTNVLLYHAVPGDPVYAATALGLGAPLDVDTALAGQTLQVEPVADPAGVQLTDGTGATARVVVTDLFCANGVIHVVDKVLLPEP